MASPSILESSVIPLRLIFLMWAIFFAELLTGIPFSAFGVVPRTMFGLICVFTSPMLHGHFAHLVSNTVPLLFLGSVLFYFYSRIAASIFLRGYLWTNVLVWLFARDANHIGASGLIYALAFFLIFFGIFRRDFTSIFISRMFELCGG